MEEEKEPKKEVNYGKAGCFIAVFILIVVIILIATGLINFPGVT